MANEPIMKTPISPKAVASAIASFAAPAILLTLLYLQTDEGKQVFSGLPPLLVILVGGLLTSAVSYVSTYVTRDKLREKGQLAMEAAAKDPETPVADALMIAKAVPTRVRKSTTKRATKKKIKE